MLCGEPSEVVTSGRDCRSTVEVAEAAYQAFEGSRTVNLPIQPKPWKAFGMPEELGGFSGGVAPKYHVDTGSKR